MNLAEYAKRDRSGSRGEFVGFQKTGDTKYLRFLYESGGEQTGSDIPARRKFYNETTGKYEYDTDQGTPTCILDCIEYDADGKNPRKVRWERSAYFCSNVLIPAWKNYPRIIDGVWKVTATNPKTRDAAYTLFPVMGADTIKFPILVDEKPADNAPPFTPNGTVAPSTAAPEVAPRKKYWE